MLNGIATSAGKAALQPPSPARTTYLKTMAKETRGLYTALGALKFDVSNYPVLTLVDD